MSGVERRGFEPSRRCDQPVQAAGLRVPGRRDLRRHPVGVGLRAARASSSRRTSRSSGGERWSPPARTSSAWTPRSSCPVRSGWPPVTSGRSVDPLTECQSCHKRFRADHLEEEFAERKGRPPDAVPLDEIALPALRHPRPVDRAAGLQHDAEDLPRRGRGRVRPALPAAGDRAGHLRQLRQRGAGDPEEAAVRHRPGRQVLPQRDHPGQLHLPHPRVRADGDGVLRRARHRRGLAPVLDRRAHPLVHRPGYRAGQPAALRAPEGEAVALLEADRRHRVPLRLRRQRLGRAGGHRQPDRLRPVHPHRALRGRPVLLRPGVAASATCPT